MSADRKGLERDEEVEELGADEEEAEEEPLGDTPRKPQGGPVLPGNLDDDVMQDDMDYEQAGDLELENSKSSPRRYEEEEDERGYSALGHIRHFSDMRKTEESEMSEGDGEEDVGGSFSSPSLAEAVKQPLYRKSKSQPTWADIVAGSAGACIVRGLRGASGFDEVAGGQPVLMRSAGVVAVVVLVMVVVVVVMQQQQRRRRAAVRQEHAGPNTTQQRSHGNHH
ncbi:hypothetical protein CRUP_006470 [Coryphaenoides rupestris]|nr:hypothetical protein CRUP_006470 [Coryphaenoides rupestris]